MLIIKKIKDALYASKIFRFCLMLTFFGAWWMFGNSILDSIKNITFSGQQCNSSKTALSLHNYNKLISYVVKPGDTFMGILAMHGISNETAIGCYQSLTPLGLNSLRPGDSLVLRRENDGSISGFSLLHKLSYWYKIKFEGSDVKAERHDVATSSQRCLVRGVLNSSLSEDMNDMGISDACVTKFAEIFAWDINFFVDPQPGDSFELVVEKNFAEGRFTGYGDILAARYVTASGHAYEAFGVPDDKGAFHYYDADGKSLQKQFLKAPLKFNHISSGFTMHRLHPVLGIVRPHLGIDYAAPTGTPVYAPADGVIVFAGYMGGYGNHIRIQHGLSYETYYGHLNNIAHGIRVGTHVSQGDLLGNVGATGLATGPHLDYRISINNRFVNPLTIVLPRDKGITPELAQLFGTNKQEYSALMSTRLKGQTGCFVLDIARSKPEVVTKRLSSNQKSGAHAG